MRLFIGIALTAFVVNSAQAQLRLPAAPLPALPVQKLTQTVGQTGVDTLQQLGDMRHVLAANLIRSNPHTIAADPHGNPVVRGELLAYASSDQVLSAAQAKGFKIARTLSNDALDIHLTVLQPPAAMNADRTRASRRARQGTATV